MVSGEYYEARYREQQIRSLAKRAQNLAFNWLFRRLCEAAMRGSDELGSSGRSRTGIRSGRPFRRALPGFAGERTGPMRHVPDQRSARGTFESRTRRLVVGGLRGRRPR